MTEARVREVRRGAGLAPRVSPGRQGDGLAPSAGRDSLPGQFCLSIHEVTP